MTDQNNSPAEAMFDKALDIAEKHLAEAMKEGGPLSSYVAVAMIEAAVNQAVEETSHDLAGLGGRHKGMVPEIDGEGRFEREPVGLPFPA